MTSESLKVKYHDLWAAKHHNHDAILICVVHLILIYGRYLFRK